MHFVSSLHDFAHRTVLLVGSGPLAAGTMRGLVDAGARVRWFSRNVDVAEEIWLTGRPSHIEIAFCELRALDFEEAAAAIATLGEPSVRQVSEAARATGCPVHVVGRPELSTLMFVSEENGADTAAIESKSPSLLKDAWGRFEAFSHQVTDLVRTVVSTRRESDEIAGWNSRNFLQ